MMGFQMFRITYVILATALLAQSALAQGTGVAFGGIQGDPTLPVDITSQSLSINQKDGEAEFDGSVLVIQGEMRLSADNLRVEYKADKSGIERLIAKGNVLLVNAVDAASADSAIYTIDTGEVIMSGNVSLSQGETTLMAPKLLIDLKTGMGRLEGGVKTSFDPKEN